MYKNIILFLLISYVISFSLKSKSDAFSHQFLVDRHIYSEHFDKFREALAETLKNHNLQERQKYFKKELSHININVKLLSLPAKSDEPSIGLKQIAFLEYMYSYISLALT